MPSFQEHLETLERWAAFPALERAEVAGSAFLTFDDGPDPDSTPAVLDALDAGGARATFFMVGEQVQAHPELAREVVARGHGVGVHTWSHHNLSRLAAGEARRELERGAGAIGHAAGVEPRLSRPPYGAFSEPAYEDCRRLGLAPVYWSGWGMDWEEIPAARIAELVLRDLGAGVVVLLHDSARYAPRASAAATAEALPAICERAHQLGLELPPLGGGPAGGRFPGRG